MTRLFTRLARLKQRLQQLRPAAPDEQGDDASAFSDRDLMTFMEYYSTLDHTSGVVDLTPIWHHASPEARELLRPHLISEERTQH